LEPHSIELARQQGDPCRLGAALNNHGEICFQLGRLADADADAEAIRSALTASA
jgi:hypothetical protein